MKNLVYLLLPLSFLISCGTENVPVYTFSASALPSEGGSVSPTFGQFSDGDLLEVTAFPTQGWKFVRWDGDVTEIMNPVEVRVSKDIRITAIFRQSEVFEVVNPATGRTWMDRNLGATRVATSSTDSLAYGYLFQWGRAADGHQRRMVPLTTELSSTDRPRSGNFIIAPNSPFDWRNPQNSALWQGLEGANNPCPTGFRIPTEEEWEAERLTWSSNDAIGAFNSPLKLPAAGRRNFAQGLLFDVDVSAYYWSSSTDDAFSRGLGIFTISAGMFSYNRAGGNSIRCIKN